MKRDETATEYKLLVSKTGDSGSWWRQAPGHPQWPSSPCRCCVWQPPLRWLTCCLELAVENQVTKSSYKLEPKWSKWVLNCWFWRPVSHWEQQHTHGTLRLLYQCNLVLFNVSHWAVWCAQLQNSLNSSHNPCRTMYICMYMPVTNAYHVSGNTVVWITICIAV